jgi:hypothetical protein
MASSSGLAFGLVALTSAAFGLGALLRRRGARLRRERYIRSYVFAPSLLDSLKEGQPRLDEKQRALVARALRQFFIVRAQAGQQAILLPSKVVDDLWLAFTSRTSDYERFCRRAFGETFPRLPPEPKRRGGLDDAAMLLTWEIACIDEDLNPSVPDRLPLLYAIDDALAIVDGQRHSVHALAPLYRSRTDDDGPALLGRDAHLPPGVD